MTVGSTTSVPITDPGHWITEMTGTDAGVTTNAPASFTYDTATNQYAPIVGASTGAGYVPGAVSPVSNGYTPYAPYTFPTTSTTQGTAGAATTTAGTPVAGGTPSTGSTATDAALAGTTKTAVTKPAAKPAAKPAGEKGAAKPAADAKPTTKEVPVTYTVKAGDNLTKIAAAHGVDWHDLYDTNKKVVGGNPNMIHPGQEYTIPGKTKTVPDGKPADTKVADTKVADTKAKPAAPAPATTTAPTTGGGGAPTAEQKKYIAQVNTIDGLASNGVKLIFQWEEQKRQDGLSADALQTLQDSIDKTEIDLRNLAAARAQIAAVLPPGLLPPDPTVASNEITPR